MRWCQKKGIPQMLGTSLWDETLLRFPLYSIAFPNQSSDLMTFREKYISCIEQIWCWLAGGKSIVLLNKNITSLRTTIYEYKWFKTLKL